MAKPCTSLSNSTIILGGKALISIYSGVAAGPLPCGGGEITTAKTQSAEWSLAPFVLQAGLVALVVRSWGKGPCSRYGWVRSNFLLLN